MPRVESHIRSVRDAAGLSQQAVADAARCDLRTYQRIEAGAIDPSFALIQRVASALGVPVCALCGRCKKHAKS